MHTNEEWRDVAGYNNPYQISNLGRIKVLQYTKLNKNGNPYTVKEKILKIQRLPTGYCYVKLPKDNRTAIGYIHRLVAKAFLINWNPELEVNHKNNDKLDNRTENLELMTASENMLHAHKYAGHRTCAKLNKLDVENIFKYREKGLTHKEISIILKVRRVTITFILNGRNMKRFSHVV